jgi:PAS domain S-box-containing protein
METNLVIENLLKGLSGASPDQDQQTAVQDRIAALELQLKIYRQAEVIGEIGNWQINLNTFETWHSENTFRIYGIEPGSVKSHPDTFSSFIIDEEREFVLNLFEKSYIERIPLHLEFRIKRADGKERHIYIVSSVTKNAKGEPLLTGITQDITVRKQLEVQLKTYTEKMKLQNESFMHAEQIGLFGTWEINLQTRQTRYSDNFFRIFGLKPSVLYPGLEEFIGFIHPDDQSIYKDALKKIFSGDVPIEAEMRIMRNDDKPRHVRIRCKLLKNVEGDPIVLGLLKDITTATRLELQLKEMNEQLQIQNETFRQAEKKINIGSWTWNLDTNQLTASDQVYVILGLKPQSIDSTFEAFDKYIHPMDRPIVERLNLEMRKEPAEKDYEYRIVRADGKIRHLRTRCHPIVSARGHQLIIGTTQDTT